MSVPQLMSGGVGGGREGMTAGGDWDYRGREGEGGTVCSTHFPVIFHCAASRPHGLLVAAGRPRGGGRRRHWLGRVGQQGGRPVVEVA